MKLATFAALPLLLGLGFIAFCADEEPLLFSDDFSSLDPAWGEADEQMHVEGNKLLLLPKVNTSYTNLYQGNLFGDVDIRVKVSQTSGQPDRPAGIAFWAASYDSFYVAEFTSDGKIGVSRKAGHGRWLNPIEWKEQHAVKKGLNVENEVRVVTKGNTVTFYVNGEQVASFKGFPPEGGSMVGLIAESGLTVPYTWAFSEFSVRKPQ